MSSVSSGGGGEDTSSKPLYDQESFPSLGSPSTDKKEEGVPESKVRSVTKSVWGTPIVTHAKAVKKVVASKSPGPSAKKTASAAKPHVCGCCTDVTAKGDISLRRVLSRKDHRRLEALADKSADEILEIFHKDTSLASAFAEVFQPEGGRASFASVEFQEPKMQKIAKTLFLNYISPSPSGKWKHRADRYYFGFDQKQRFAEAVDKCLFSRPMAKELSYAVTTAIDETLSELKEVLDDSYWEDYRGALIGVALSGDIFKKAGKRGDSGKIVINPSKELFTGPKSLGLTRRDLKSMGKRPIGDVLMPKLEKKLRAKLPEGVGLEVVKKINEAEGAAYYPGFEFCARALVSQVNHARKNPRSSIVHPKVLDAFKGIKGRNVGFHDVKRMCVEHGLILRGNTMRMMALTVQPSRSYDLDYHVGPTSSKPKEERGKVSPHSVHIRAACNTCLMAAADMAFSDELRRWREKG